MPIRKGSSSIASVRHGATAISRVYKGTASVFESFNPVSLFSAGQMGVIYDMQDLSSMFQTTDTSTPAAVGQPVGRINDKSGNAKHATQATAAARPILRQTAGGKYYLEADGVDDHLTAPFGVAMATPFHRISAIRQITWTVNDQVFGDIANGSTAMLYNPTVSPRLALFNGIAGPTNDGLAVGADGVVSEYFENSGNTSLTVNNAASATGVNAGGNTPTGLMLLGGTGGKGNMRLYRLVMIKKALTAAEIADIRKWCASGAGINL